MTRQMKPADFKIGDRVMKRNGGKAIGSQKAFAPLKGTVVDTYVAPIKTKKGYTRRRFYDVIFEGRSNTPEKKVWSHMLQRAES